MKSLIADEGAVNPPSRKQSPRKDAAQSRWLLVFLLLAGANVVIVGANVYFGQRVNASHSQALTVNNRWADRLGQFSDLSQLAAAANAPPEIIRTWLINP